jgi:two-component system, OmpR family, sensor kinase
MGALRHRLSHVGLRWRLAGWVALVLTVCTGITFVAVYRGTGTQLRKRIDGEVAGDVSELAQELRVAGARSPAQLAKVAGRYVEGQPLTASSTLLFAIVPGAGVATNRPELFNQGPPDEGETTAQQAQENRVSAQLLATRDGYATLALPDVGNLRVLKDTIRLPVRGSPRLAVTVGAGEPLAAVGHAQAGVARAFILAGILALVGALLGAYLIGSRVSRPLRRMAAVATRVDAGDLHPRIDDAGDQGEEVRVLADAFNHMLDRLTDAFARQRAFVADASHELRTPLTVIRGQLEVLAAQESPPGDEVRRVERLVQAELTRISRLVDDLLVLAKTDRSQGLRIAPIDLRGFAHELWHGVGALASRRFELGPVPAGTLYADPDLLAQALRNLIVNAIQHTSEDAGVVSLTARADARGWVSFSVEDDGPGIPPAERDRVFDRFHRVDAARDRASGGTGLGLAIVAAIAEAHGGCVAASDSPRGGACIELLLPRFVSSAGAPPRRDDVLPDAHAHAALGALRPR